MPPIAAAKAPSPADARIAKQLLSFFPWMGQLWSSAVRETGAGSFVRFKTLGILHGRGPIRAGEVALLCGTTPSALSEVVEGLVADGFVHRVDDPTDRRAVMVALTESGEVELQRIGDLMTAAMARVFEGLTSEQKARLRAAVADIHEILIAPSAQKETRIVR
jgi:DNA-binding MarR family transcriptional regulator